VTRGGKTIRPDPEAELRHNHFSRHLKGRDKGHGCGGRESRGKHCGGAMKDIVRDTSFQEYYRRISSAEP